MKPAERVRMTATDQRLESQALWKLLGIEVVRGYGDTAIDFDVPCVVFGTRDILDLTSIFVEGLKHPALRSWVGIPVCITPNEAFFLLGVSKIDKLNSAPSTGGI
jgi:hypothetical protein